MKLAATPGQSRVRGLSEIRRATAVANTNAEASLENLLQESDDQRLVMPAMELVSALRRFSYRVNAIAPLAVLEDFSSDRSLAQLGKLCDQIESLALALEANATPRDEKSSVIQSWNEHSEACELHGKCVLGDQVPALQQLTEIMSDAVIALSRCLRLRFAAQQ